MSLDWWQTIEQGVEFWRHPCPQRLISGNLHLLSQPKPMPSTHTPRIVRELSARHLRDVEEPPRQNGVLPQPARPTRQNEKHRPRRFRGLIRTVCAPQGRRINKCRVALDQRPQTLRISPSAPCHEKLSVRCQDGRNSAQEGQPLTAIVGPGSNLQPGLTEARPPLEQLRPTRECPTQPPTTIRQPSHPRAARHS